MANKVYEYVTERIIKLLEEGTVPWKKPWKNGLPINYITRKPYRGVNLFLLPGGGEYLTFKQVQKLGGKIKKGAKAHMVVFWKQVGYEEEKLNDDGETEIVIRTLPILRYYKVFSLSDTEGIPSKLEKFDNNPIKEAEKVLNGFKEVPIYHRENSAYYEPMKDYINLPTFDQFENAELYYSTAFHEMVHSTGHESRLARFKSTDSHIFGSETYSFEELVAELGASMLSGTVGIEEYTINNSAAYISGWLSRLRDDKTLIVKAAGKAQKACDYISKAAGLAQETEDDALEEAEEVA